jgi:Schlafen group 3, DNA/RNA helicase domain
VGSDGRARARPWPICANRETFVPAIKALVAKLSRRPINVEEWAASPYKPTPTIVEAAQALYQGHDVQEISHSEAGAENLSRTAAYVTEVINDAKQNHKKAICFVTGVPGSGKTLAGLNIANGHLRGIEEEHAVFLSGNGPLVAVLREALALDEVQRTRANSGRAASKKDAYRHASAFIQNIHHFRDEYVRSATAPTERVVVFDEAQRAWGKEQTSRFMREKRGHSAFNMSEPQFLLSIMDRHQDWCVVVCLIGGGQEINTGEAGLQEWLTTISQNYPYWHVHCSNRLTRTDYLGGSVGSLSPGVTETPRLHLSVSVRSFRAEVVSDFVGAVIDGNDQRARSLSAQLTSYPVVLTHDLEAARTWLRQNARGTERIGLVASSNALRLKPVGLHVKAKIDPPAWFLADKTDVRSSYALEDVATEFDIQGLELDWVGACWDANFRREGSQWGYYNFRGSRWECISDPTRIAYLANAYRVLLTRARQGMVIYVPYGSEIDDTRKPAFYEETYAFLRDCGILELAEMPL